MVENSEEQTAAERRPRRARAVKAEMTEAAEQKRKPTKTARKPRAKASEKEPAAAAPTEETSVKRVRRTRLAIETPETTEEAPAKRTRRTRTAVPGTAGASEMIGIGSVEASEQAPARRTRRVRTAVAESAEAPEDASAQRTRRTRSAGADAPEAAEEAPARRTRRTRAAAAEDSETSESTGSAEASSSTPVRRTQQRERGVARQNGARQNSKQNNNSHRRTRRTHPGQQPREVAPSVSREDLAKLKVVELRERAAELGIATIGLKKAELIEAVFEQTAKAEGFTEVSGVLDILADGYGFVRTQGYLPSETDCYVGLSMIRRNGLRKGDLLVGQTRPARENEKYAAIQKLISVNGMPPEEAVHRVKFSDLTPVYPDERLVMEHGHTTYTSRVIDLTAPIGKGQRGLIVSPPKAGKTTILKDIAASIAANNPEVHLMCLLIDERPEEVTDMERSVKGEVVSSTFDMPCENHIAVAELVIERAKRLVEAGEDVVILLDSITRLARAYNLAQPASGRILSGGVDSTALYPPKRFLGAARNIEHGGSLTILASALIDTGSKMDEVIFEEFKGTGNMELRLDRNLADRRIFPAIDPVASGTRKEELLLDPQEAPLIWAVRRLLANLNNTERAMDMLIKSLKQTKTNQEFLLRAAKKAQHGKPDGSFEL